MKIKDITIDDLNFKIQSRMYNKVKDNDNFTLYGINIEGNIIGILASVRDYKFLFYDFEGKIISYDKATLLTCGYIKKEYRRHGLFGKLFDFVVNQELKHSLEFIIGIKGDGHKKVSDDIKYTKRLYENRFERCEQIGYSIESFGPVHLLNGYKNEKVRK